jgi:FixJ family two-component response regulator
MKERQYLFVVDDDESVRTSLATLLDSDGYTVESFVSASEFLKRAPNVGPACLVLDVRLPGLDGFALQQELAEQGRMEEIVFITGYGDIPMGIRAMKRGAVDFLPKPFEDQALLNAVAQAIARSADRWQNRKEVAQISARIAMLTRREFEVFCLVIAGLLNKQIAAELGAALRTIKTHRGRVMRKLGVQSVADLVRLAQKVEISLDPASKDHIGSGYKL